MDSGTLILIAIGIGAAVFVFVSYWWWEVRPYEQHKRKDR